MTDSVAATDAAADEEVCAICREALSSLPCRTVVCKHVFHAACYMAHVAHCETVVTCPVCRRQDPDSRPPISAKTWLRRADTVLMLLLVACMLGCAVAELDSALEKRFKLACNIIMLLDTAVIVLLRRYQ
jgi:hypothetical protein